MPRMLASKMLAASLFLLGLAGCANHRWGFPGGQGTIERQKARAAVHDPYPLNDLGPEVVGGRPREFYAPQPEAVRIYNTSR
ncbi:MAG: membrane or secreted protein [Pirellulaceae bacterium]